MVAERRAAASLLRGLNRKGLPCIEIPPTQISVLRSPSDFYAQLLARAAAAQRRIALASLYVGDGARERELVGALQNAPVQTDIHLLLANSRMQRGGGLALLAPLARRADATVRSFDAVARQPQLARHAPPLANEVLGVPRKGVRADDTVVLPRQPVGRIHRRRQDRYVVPRRAGARRRRVRCARGGRRAQHRVRPDGAAATKHLGGAERKPLWPAPPPTASARRRRSRTR